MKIALASPPYPKSIDDGLMQIEIMVKDAAAQKASIICFPESYIPGYPAGEFQPEKSTPEKLKNALEKACSIAKKYAVAIILPMDWFVNDEMLNVAFVILRNGEMVGYQTKNQLDPSEDNIWIPGKQRHIFEVDNLKFGITICHEGFRYPESVRWAAMHGAAIVFHPQLTGSNICGPTLTEWCHASNPYYEKAMMMRALENTIYFASVNYATAYQESATSLIAPDGKCIKYQVYGKAGVFVADIDVSFATGLLAKRFKPILFA